MIGLLLAVALADVEVESAPSTVTVFFDRARVTRTVSVRADAGRNAITFRNLPPGTQSGSVSADLRGAAQLEGVDLVRVTAAEVANRRIREIEDELVQLGDDKQDAIDEANSAQAALSAVQTGRTASAQALSAQLLVGSDAPGRARGLRTQLGQTEGELRARLRSAQRAQRELDAEIASLQRERSMLGSGGTDEWQAVVQLRADRAGTVEIDLSYLVGGASWVPRYDLRGDRVAGKVELGLSAMVQQSTGEDWDDVELSVSSARPGLGTVVPELAPFWLQPRQTYILDSIASAPSADRGGMAKGRAKKAEMSAPAPPPPPMEPMEVETAQVQVQLSATAFTVPRPTDVPPDGTERKVLLTTEALDAELRWVVVPRLDPRAYLVGEVKNTAGFPLLAGEAGVFLDGAYLGDMGLELVAPGDTFDVAFGIDDKVKIRREALEVEEGGKVGLGNKRSRATFRFGIDVENGHGRSLNVELEEQIPVSNQDDVEVRLVESGKPKEEPGGMLTWTFAVPSRQTKRFEWGYVVEHPADFQPGWLE